MLFFFINEDEFIFLYVKRGKWGRCSFAISGNSVCWYFDTFRKLDKKIYIFNSSNVIDRAQIAAITQILSNGMPVNWVERVSILDFT